MYYLTIESEQAKERSGLQCLKRIPTLQSAVVECVSPGHIRMAGCIRMRFPDSVNPCHAPDESHRGKNLRLHGHHCPSDAGSRALHRADGGVLFKGGSRRGHRGGAEHGCENRHHRLEGAHWGSQNLPAGGSHHCPRHRAGLLRHGGGHRRRRSGRHCHPLRLLPL